MKLTIEEFSNIVLKRCDELDALLEKEPEDSEHRYALRAAQYEIIRLASVVVAEDKNK
jgi:hypothetical protein